MTTAEYEGVFSDAPVEPIDEIVFPGRSVFPEFADVLQEDDPYVLDDELSIGVQETILDEDPEADVAEDKGWWDRVKDWGSRNKGKLVMGAAAVSLAVTLTNNPITELKDDVIDAAPWVASGVGASEVAFVVGGAMMVRAVSKSDTPLREKLPAAVDRLGDNLYFRAGVATTALGALALENKYAVAAGALTMAWGAVDEMNLKKRIPEMAQRANDSALFKAGFVVNTAGAVGDFVVLSGGVLKEMPVESWPILGLTLADLGVTVAVRKAILRGVHENSDDDKPPEADGQVIEAAYAEA